MDNLQVWAGQGTQFGHKNQDKALKKAEIVHCDGLFNPKAKPDKQFVIDWIRVVTLL